MGCGSSQIPEETRSKGGKEELDEPPELQNQPGLDRERQVPDSMLLQPNTLEGREYQTLPDVESTKFPVASFIIGNI